MFESEHADLNHRISLDNKYEPDTDIALYLRSKFSEIVRKRRGNHCIPLAHQWPSTKAIQNLYRKLLASLFTQQQLSDMSMFVMNDPTTGLELF